MRYRARTTTGGKAEARLRALPQFTTMIDGLDNHFIHIRSRYSNALHLIMTHGSLGSVFELLKTVGPLRIPCAMANARRTQSTTSCLRLSASASPASRRAPVRSRWDRARMGGANELRALRYPWRRLGRTHLQRAGASGHCKTARHPHELAGNRFIRSHRSARRRRSYPACLTSKFPPGAGATEPGVHSPELLAGEYFVLLRRVDKFAGLPMRPHAGYHRDFLE
jgi:Epoxide hydrolase N terminus